MQSIGSILSRVGEKIFPFRLAIGLAIALFALEWLSPRPFFAPHYRLLHGLALLVIAGGLALRAWAAGHAGGHTRSGEIEAGSLATGGPFGHVRNPIYVGSMCLGLGMSLLIGDPCALLFSAIAFTILYLAIIPAEERFLSMRFGSEYAAYCASVPRLFPRLTRWKNDPPIRFRWRAAAGEFWIFLILVAIYAALLFEEHLDAIGLS